MPKLNFNQIKFSENLKGEADILVIEEVTGKGNASANKKSNFTQRSPPNQIGKGELRTNTERSEPRFISGRPASKIDSRKNKTGSKSSSMVGNKSDMFLRR